MSLPLTLLVTDVNDNAPVFEREQYNASVREDAAVGEEILQVVATDRDRDTLTYALLPGKHVGAFSIDGKTGSLRVAQVIDAESLDSLRFELNVTASDGPIGQSVHTATATVVVCDH